MCINLGTHTQARIRAAPRHIVLIELFKTTAKKSTTARARDFLIQYVRFYLSGEKKTTKKRVGRRGRESGKNVENEREKTVIDNFVDLFHVKCISLYFYDEQCDIKNFKHFS